MAEATETAAAGETTAAQTSTGATALTGSEQPAQSETAQQTEKQSGETGKQAEGQQTDKKDAAAPEVPEKYALKLPDGVKLEDALMQEFTAVGHDLKLTGEQAQRLADLHLKATGEFARQAAEQAQQEALEEARNWSDEIE